MHSDSPRSGADGTAEPLENAEDSELSFTRDRYAIYECKECENIAMTARAATGQMSCHGREMEEITEWAIETETPDLRETLLSAFGLPKMGLEICLCVIDEGPIPAGEAAEILGYDRSTTSRYLNDLATMGLLEKTPLNREDGGVINVYHSMDPGAMRRQTLIGFYAWAGQAASMLEDANITKDEYLETGHKMDLNEVFWEAMEAERATNDN